MPYAFSVQLLSKVTSTANVQDGSFDAKISFSAGLKAIFDLDPGKDMSEWFKYEACA